MIEYMRTRGGNTGMPAPFRPGPFKPVQKWCGAVRANLGVRVQKLKPARLLAGRGGHAHQILFFLQFEFQEFGFQ
jgi:hypothetical protein